MKRIKRPAWLIIPLALLILATAFVADDNREFEISKNIEIFANLYREINAYYVDDLEPGKLMRTGIDAMVGSLDPYTNYLAESDIESYRLNSEGRYFGIGVQSATLNDYVTITELYKDQPADRAGLKVGDRILAVNGADAKGKTPVEVDFILRGAPGTKATITVERPGERRPIDIELTRGEVRIPNVPFNTVIGEDDIAYISLTTFTFDAGRNVSNALRDLRTQYDLKGVVLDLRDNGGGLLMEAVNVCNVFIPKDELVVTTKSKVRDWDRSFSTLNMIIEDELPLAVLINKNSASASEIVSGVIQDYDRGVLVGQRSYGKGLVQNTKDIGYNSSVKITTAKYYIPSGRCIQSVEYQNGEPVNIPDEQRAKFKTRNGRTVLDGGGVAPDLYVDHPENNPVVKVLVSKYLIFDFVTEYFLDHPVPENIEDFHFADFPAFLSYLDEKKVAFNTPSEQTLQALKTSTSEEGYRLDNQLRELEERIQAEQRRLINENQEVITDLIEKEVAGRFFFQEGKVKMGLRNDQEVVEAIAILKDPERYQKTLNKK